MIVLKANPSKSEVLGCLSEPVEKPKPWYKHYTSLRFGEKVKVHIKKEAFKKRGLRFGDVIRIVYSRYTPTDVPYFMRKRYGHYMERKSSGYTRKGLILTTDRKSVV